MALQLKGALLARREGDAIQYRHRCDKCGHIEASLHLVTAGTAGWISSTSFRCYNCENQQPVEIREEQVQ
jgi:DNA-directed RNA polymerase subunit M/transcription elongation factor TFIIS